MLSKLSIENIALIDTLHVSFAPGMNCLTGETGAGKSIIIDSIGALLGSRASRELIRSGAESGSVHGVFTELSDFTREAMRQNAIPPAPQDESALYIDREIAFSGRNVCKINGKMVSSAVLRSIGETLVDIHGQHENQSLTRTESHIRLLDAFGDAEMSALKDSYHGTLHEFRELRKELTALSGEPSKREQMMDLLRYQVREIEAAQLSVGEEEELIQRRNIFNHAEKIYEHLTRAAQIADADAGAGGGGDETESALSVLQALNTELSAIASLGEPYRTLSENAAAIYYETEELARGLHDASAAAVYDPAEADWIGQRLDYLYKLKLKYGNTIEDVLQFAEEARAKLQFFSDSEANIQRIEARMNVLSEELYGICEEMSFTRRKIADELEKRICEELADLEMPNTRFHVQIDFSYENDADGYPVFDANGLDQVEFLIAPNRGEPLKPLARIASGGELSRIMLAIKTILNATDRISTMIFDEIDTGISGLSARRIAEKLRALSEAHQVICVTHHAQIAAAARRNLYISKTAVGARTVTQLKILNDEEKIQEISRLLDGDRESEITNVHARELIARYNG